MLKARVTWNAEKRRWQVWEDEPGKKFQHHSFHHTEAEARATARAQNRINKREAAIPALNQ